MTVTATQAHSTTPSNGQLPIDALALARMTPAGFARFASRGQWEFASHLVILNRALVDLSAGRIKRLMVNMPPRHGKSWFNSYYYPCWYLGTYPDRRVILTSYEAHFAALWGRRCRDLMQEYGWIFGITVKDDSRAADRWDIGGHMGGMFTAGVGGAITGRGANILLIDDPIKNGEQARSYTYREKTWDWYNSTAYTRLEKNGAILLTMTRWNYDDLAGRLLKAQEHGGDQWTVIDMPAIALDNDLLGRPAGAALWPSRYSRHALDTIKTQIGSYWFNAQYQQRPVAAEDGLFKQSYFRSYRVDGDTYVLLNPDGTPYKRVPTERCWRFITVDLAVSTRATADYTVCTVFAVTPDNELLIIDMLRERMEGADHPAMIKSLYAKWRPVFIGIEKVAYQATLVQMMVRAGLPIRELVPDRDKVTRALPLVARYEAGMVYHPEHAHYLEALESELLGFPNGADHDDIVDTLSYGVHMIVTDNTPRVRRL